MMDLRRLWYQKRLEFAAEKPFNMLDATKELNAENAEKKPKFKKLSGLCELGGKKM